MHYPSSPVTRATDALPGPSCATHVSACVLVEQQVRVMHHLRQALRHVLGTAVVGEALTEVQWLVLQSQLDKLHPVKRQAKA